MTWLGDEQAKIKGPALEKLMAERAAIVKEIEVLGRKPLPNSTNSAKIGRQEDLIALAKKIKAIDKKLGRDSQYA